MAGQVRQSRLEEREMLTDIVSPAPHHQTTPHIRSTRHPNMSKSLTTPTTGLTQKKRYISAWTTFILYVGVLVGVVLRQHYNKVGLLNVSQQVSLEHLPNSQTFLPHYKNNDIMIV